MRLDLPVRHYVRYPYDSPQGLVSATESIDLEHAAVLVVDAFDTHSDDLREGLIGTFSSQSRIRHQAVLHERIAPMLQAARNCDIPIIYSENRWAKGVWGGSEFGLLVDRVESGHLGRFDELYPTAVGQGEYSDDVAPRPSDVRVAKTMYDGFFETGLDSVLRNWAVKHVICVGFSAEICLLNTALGALYRNYRVVVLRDCVLASEYDDTIEEQAMLRWAIRLYESIVGFTSTSREFSDACGAVGTAC